jgi:hypothetical protein
LSSFLYFYSNNKFVYLNEQFVLSKLPNLLTKLKDRQQQLKAVVQLFLEERVAATNGTLFPSLVYLKQIFEFHSNYSKQSFELANS